MGYGNDVMGQIRYDKRVHSYEKDRSRVISGPCSKGSSTSTNEMVAKLQILVWNYLKIELFSFVPSVEGILINYSPQRVLSDCPLRRKASYGPHPDFNPGEELLASHIPNSPDRNRLLLGVERVSYRELFACQQ